MLLLRGNRQKPRVEDEVVEAVRRFGALSARMRESDADPIIVEQLGPRPDDFDAAARADHRQIAQRLQPDARARDYDEDNARDRKKLRPLVLPLAVLLVLLVAEPSLNFRVFQSLGVPPESRWTYVFVLSVAFIGLIHYIRESENRTYRKLAVISYVTLACAVGLARASVMYDATPSNREDRGAVFALIADGVLLVCTVVIVPFVTSVLLTRVREQWTQRRAIWERSTYIRRVQASTDAAKRERDQIVRAGEEWDRAREFLQAVFEVARRQAHAEIEQFRNDDN